MNASGAFSMSAQEKQQLLAVARETIAARLDGRPPDPQHGEEPQGVFARRLGVFVSLHRADGALRGCIGRMDSELPLWEAVRQMSLAAAFDDPRFAPLTACELAGCRIEISVLSPMTPCVDPDAIEVGVHGLYLRCRGRSGVFLPQVPVEQGWSREEYLAHLCAKASLPPRAHLADGAQLATFTALVFGE